MLMNVHQFLAYTEHVTIQTETLHAFVKKDGQAIIAIVTSMNATLQNVPMVALVIIMMADFFARASQDGMDIVVKLM